MRFGNELKIGPLAQRTGCSVPTIRYYEQIGLLPAAARRAGGHRVYGDADLRRLTFIRRCRDLGFTIEQIREIAALADAVGQDCIAARDLARRRLDDLRRTLKELHALERSLKRLIEDCNVQCAGGPAEKCVILADWTPAKQPACCRPGAQAR